LVNVNPDKWKYAGYFAVKELSTNFVTKNMKADNLLILLSVVIMILTGCTKADEADRANVGTLTYPIASFSYSGNEQPSPVVVSFTNTSQYANAYRWNFGDGITSTEINPSHKFINSTPDPKNFLVVLTATDTTTMLSNTRSQAVRILPSKK